MFTRQDLQSNMTTMGSNLFDLDLQTGRAVKVVGGKLIASPGKSAAHMSMQGRSQAGHVFTQINTQQIQAFCQFFGHPNAYAPNQYRSVKTLPDWRAAYGVIPAHQFPTIDRLGNAGNVQEDGVPCAGCNVVMPLRCLSIDHQRPQVGGRIAAVFRVFRALGLTVAGPSGAKGQQAFQANAANVGGIAIPGALQNQNNRYRLNLPGQMYFTLLNEDDDVWKNAQDQAMHHYINLRPMCGPCNSSLGNQNALVF